MPDWITEDEMRLLNETALKDEVDRADVRFLCRLIDKADREIRSLRAMLPGDMALRTKQFENREADAHLLGWKDGRHQKEYNPQQIDSSYINLENWSATELELLRTKYMEGYMERGRFPAYLSTEDKK